MPRKDHLPRQTRQEHITLQPPLLIEKHFSRKHGPNAYYGQK